MKLLIPPPLLGLITGVLIWGAAKYFSQFGFAAPGQRTNGILFIAAGVLIEIVAVATFFRSKTSVNPMKPDAASKLVTTGLFKLTRNPMYLSLLCILIGWAIFLGSLPGLALSALYVWYMTVFQIKPEESALTQKFGDDYLAYCKRVRRWI